MTFNRNSTLVSVTSKQKVSPSLCDFKQEKKLKVVPVKACRNIYPQPWSLVGHWVFRIRDPVTKWIQCWEFCFLHIKDLSAKEYKPFLGMRMKWHSMNLKDPWLLSHRIFLGRKFDLQVNGILKKYETKLPLSLNYSEVFLEEIITGPKYFGPKTVDQKV